MKLSNVTSYCLVIAYLLMTCFQLLTIPEGWQAFINNCKESDVQFLKNLMSWHAMGALGIIFLCFTIVYPLFFFVVILAQRKTGGAQPAPPAAKR